MLTHWNDFLSLLTRFPGQVRIYRWSPLLFRPKLHYQEQPIKPLKSGDEKNLQG